MVINLKQCLCIFVIISSCVCKKKGGSRVALQLQVNARHYSSAGANEHRFVDDEGTDFRCFSSLANATYVLTYISSEGNATEVRCGVGQPGKMYMKLRRVDSGSTVTCGVQPAPGDVTGASNVSVRLLLDENPETFRFKVNGLVLGEDSRYSIPSRLYYTYVYSLGEVLTVTALPPHPSPPHHLHCTSTCQTEVNGTYFQRRYEDFTNFTYTMDKQINAALDCYLENERRSWTIGFSKDYQYYGPAFFGLSSSNILLRYSDVTTNVIKYEVGDEPLLVSCPGQYYEDPMNFKNFVTHLVFDKESLTAEMPEYKPINRFRLRPGRDQADITCQYNNPSPKQKIVKTVLTLLRRRNASVEARGATTGITAVNILWILAVVLACLSLVAIIYAAVVCIRKKEPQRPLKRTHSSPILQYQNLCARSQLVDEVIYDTTNNTQESLYANLSTNERNKRREKPALDMYSQEAEEPTYSNLQTLERT